MEKTCADCIYFDGTWDYCGQTAYNCKLTNMISKGIPCELFNVDLSKENICYNCKHFRGGGDWGLACAKYYHRLPEALTEACGDFERK